MFLYLLNISLPFHLFRLLCLRWPFCMLEVCGSSLLWRFLPVGGVGWVACQRFLVREAWPMFWWVELYLFSLECNEVSSHQLWDVCEFGVTFGHLYFCAQGYVPFLVGELAWYVFSETCWLLGGSWFQCRYGDFWVSACLLMFPGIRSALMFSSFGVKPLASGF